MLKDLIREILIRFQLDITKNIKYDRLTRTIINKHVKGDSVCVDVGAHKGEITQRILSKIKNGKIFAFEPIPYYVEVLKKKFSNNVYVYNYALSNSNEVTEFHYIKNAPGYSGLKRREYAVAVPEIELIQVETIRLDDLIKEKIDFIKIDVEGAELLVLQGAENAISQFKPLVLFECGLGASEYYQTKPDEIFKYFNEKNMKIYTLENFITNGPPIDLPLFKTLYYQRIEYYFVAK